MPCKKSKRKHTPIVSERQRRFFGAEYGRAKRGEGRETGITKADLRSHLKEVGGVELPEKAKKRKALSSALRRRRR
mgnify:CR=1 FL=1